MIDITNNIWDFAALDLFHGDEDDTLGAGSSNLDDDESFLADAGNMNTVEDALLGGISRLADGGFDPRPQAGSPALSNELANLPEGDDFFEEVSYQGAFSKDNNWMQGWTYLSEAGYLAASNASNGEIVNVSARANLDAGETLIPGFTVIGTKTVLIRAVGAKLADLGLANPMADPRMTLFKMNFDGSPNDEIIVVDDWTEGNIAKISAAAQHSGLFPFTPAIDFQGIAMPTDDTTSAAALVTLETGVYTAVVDSADGGTGDVLVDVTEVE